MGEQLDPQVVIRVRSDQGERVFCISDSSMGIEPEYHEKIFNIFEKIDPQSGWIGAGLAQV